MSNHEHVTLAQAKRFVKGDIPAERAWVVVEACERCENCAEHVRIAHLLRREQVS